MPPLIELRGIVKRFGAVTALKGVDFHIDHGEVVGLVGDNGAGKSTLAKIIVGYYKPDEGEIYYEGERIEIKSPAHARRLGIEIVYQDMALAPYMSVWRNLFLSREVVKRIGPIRILDKRRMREMARSFLAEIGVRRRDPDAPIGKLSGGERQSIAIARAVFFDAKLVVLDEPTSALSIKETERVLDLIREMSRRGIASILISHNIYHVYNVADRIVVLDHGRKVLDVEKDRVTPEDIIDVIAHRKTPQQVLGRG